MAKNKANYITRNTLAHPLKNAKSSALDSSRMKIQIKYRDTILEKSYANRLYMLFSKCIYLICMKMTSQKLIMAWQVFRCMNDVANSDKKICKFAFFNFL